MKATLMANFGATAPVLTSAPRRVCAEPGCHVRLSIYNHGRYCALHEDASYSGPEKQCRTCGAIKPATDEFWVRDRYRADGWVPVCKACRNPRSQVNYERRRLSRRDAHEVECRQCGRTLKRTGDNWSFGAKGRLIQPCLDCQDENRKRRAAKTLDRYYRRKYGTTRAGYVEENGDAVKAVTVVFPHREQIVEVGP